LYDIIILYHQLEVEEGHDVLMEVEEEHELSSPKNLKDEEEGVVVHLFHLQTL
jgi:hypothetical protein